MRPLVRNGEKYLLPLANGDYIIERNIKILKKIFNIRNVYLVVRDDVAGHVYDKLSQHDIRNIYIIKNNKYKLFENSFSFYLGLREALRDGGDVNGFIIMNSDIVLINIINNINNIVFDDGSVSIISASRDTVLTLDYMRGFSDPDGTVRYIGFDVPKHVANFFMGGVYVPRGLAGVLLEGFESVGERAGWTLWFESVLNVLNITGRVHIRSVPLLDNFVWHEVDTIEDYRLALDLDRVYGPSIWEG